MILDGGCCRTALQNGVVDVALRATAIKSVGTRLIQRRGSFDARWEVRIRDKLHAERDRIGRPFGDRRLRLCDSELLVRDVHAAEGLLERSANRVIALMFSHQEEGKIALVHFPRNVGEGREQIAVAHAVDVGARPSPTFRGKWTSAILPTSWCENIRPMTRLALLSSRPSAACMWRTSSSLSHRRRRRSPKGRPTRLRSA